jgi:aryl-alcohol dehydrogenase-like predicted oxidoreductase
MLRAFDDLVRLGKIRYTACSNYEAWRLMEALWISDSKALARFEAYQPQYSLVVPDIEEELVPTCTLKGLSTVVWAPLAGGYLSGKYRPGEHSLPSSRSAENWAFPTQFFHLEHEAILTELLVVARRLGRNAAQVAVRWVLEQPLVASAIVGARTAEQLSDTLDAAGWRLPEEAREQLDKVSAQAAPLSSCHGRDDGRTAQSGGAYAERTAIAATRQMKLVPPLSCTVCPVM